MRVVVTGATGNVGTSVVAALQRDDRIDSIVAIARRQPESWQFTAANTAFAAADVVYDDLASAFAGADVIVHLAWLFQPTHEPLVTWKANAIGSTRVFAAAAAAGVKAIVHASSVGAYSPGGADQFVDETWPTNSIPTASYGREKAYVERVLDGFEARHPDIRVVRMRPAFIFKRSSATQQRRLFAGPFVPNWIANRRLPIVPLPEGLRFQALHTSDAADAYRRAVVMDVRGAFNLASDGVLDTDELAHIVGGRAVLLPPAVMRAALWGAWHLHAVPAEPALFDLVMRLPLLSTARARNELDWHPRISSSQALRRMLTGLGDGAGDATEPLAPDAPAHRLAEVATGVGQRDHLEA